MEYTGGLIGNQRSPDRLQILNIKYRVTQVLWSLTARFRPVDEVAADAVLQSPALIALFRQMPRVEQQHGIRVMKALQMLGHDNPDLLTAALLHDCGKMRYGFSLFGRVLVVAVRKALPRQYAEWSRAAPSGWKRPFAISEQHPAWSAEVMEKAGASQTAVNLARRHQMRFHWQAHYEEDRLLKALQGADEWN